MGKLLQMPSQDSHPFGAESLIDFSVWRAAPRERTPEYFPVYAAISKAIQTAIRVWVRDWFHDNLEVLRRPQTAYPVLVYQCTHPFSGAPTNVFTYDVQHTESLYRAYRSAASRMARALKALDTKKFDWFTRECYFAYRGDEVIKHVMKNQRALFRMFNTETKLVDALLKFALMDIDEMGLDEAVVAVRKSFQLHLKRFSDEFDLSAHSEELLRLATETLLAKLPQEAVLLAA